MGSRSRLVIIALAVLVAMLVLAVPAMAASNVKQGDTKMLTPSTMVTHLQAKNVTVNAVAPVTYTAQWKSALSWLFDAKMAMKSGTKYTTYNTKTGAGVFYHTGGLLWVESSATAHLPYKWQGMRLVANNKNSYSLVVTAGNAKPYVANDIVATSKHQTKITHSGKKYHIDGIQFYLTAAGAEQLQTALNENAFSTTLMVFDGDIYFTMK